MRRIFNNSAALRLVDFDVDDVAKFGEMFRKSSCKRGMRDTNKGIIAN